MNKLNTVLRSLLGCAALMFTVATVQAETLFTLGNVKLDGTVGENTYIAKGSAASASALALENGNLNWTTIGGTTYDYILSYFTPQSLGIGDSLTLGYTFTAPAGSFNTTAMALRVGLFNSNGALIDGDIASTGNSTFNNYKGLGASYTPGGSTAGKYGSRGSGNSVLFGGWANYGGANPDLANPTYTTINGTLTITRTDTGLTLGSSIGGVDAGTFDILTTAANYTDTFDTLGFFDMHFGATSSLYTFTNLTVTLIPEPSTVTLLLAGGALLLGLNRKKLRAILG